jgi:hypothetical protein
MLNALICKRSGTNCHNKLWTDMYKLQTPFNEVFGPLCIHLVCSSLSVYIITIPCHGIHMAKPVLGTYPNQFHPVHTVPNSFFLKSLYTNFSRLSLQIQYGRSPKRITNEIFKLCGQPIIIILLRYLVFSVQNNFLSWRRRKKGSQKHRSLCTNLFGAISKNTATLMTIVVRIWNFLNSNTLP